MRLRNRLALRVAIATICAHSIFSFFGGGFVSAEDANGNTVTVSDETVTSHITAGESTSGDANDNSLTISDSSIGGAAAGYTSAGDANNNTTIINNVVANGFVHGGYAYAGMGNSNNNTLIMNGGTVAHIHAGHAHGGNANNNTFIMNGGTITSETGAGFTDAGNVAENTLTINDGELYGSIYAARNFGSGTTDGNKTYINGGTFYGNVYGGWSDAGDVTNSEINISGSPNLENSTLYASYAPNGTSSGNSLNIYTKDLTAQNVSGFQNLNIYLPEDISNGDSILTLTSSSGTDLTETAVSIGKSAGTSVTEGAQINLITNANGLTVSDIDFDNSIYEGITLKYGADLAVQDNSLVLTVGSFQGVNENTKIISDSASVIGSIVRTTTGRTIRIFEEECYKDIDSLEFELENEIRPFASISTENIRTKLGGGAYLDTKTHGIDLGYSKKFQTNHGIITIAPIFDYSTGSYDTYLPNNLHGTGDSTYFSGGAIARIARDSGLYYEGSLRYGRAESDFYANEFPIGSASTTFVRYDVGTPVISGHMHIGRFYRFGKRNKIQVYTQYAHAYQASTDTDLSTGEHYEFDSLNLGTSKTGVRMISSPRDNSTFYTGLAFQYDLGNDAVAHYQDYSTPKTDTSGSTGILELGYQYRPTERSPWALDFNALGMVGNEKGVSFQMKIKKAF